MLYPKPTKKKKRKAHKASIMHGRDGTCYLCMMLNQDYSYKKTLQEHHVFNGPNRSRSEAEGLKVFLCLEHHTAGPAAVHNNAENMLLLKREGQRVYERDHTREEFTAAFGKNYLD